MNILLTNDDGVLAEGIAVMFRALREAGHRVVMVAPHEERSASGHGITWKNPLKVRKLTIENELVYALEGTPADCTRFGLLEVMPEADIVVSGINFGANTGIDTLYSGTVSAAMEAVLLGKPALAVSRDFTHDNQHFDTAARMALRVLEGLAHNPMPTGCMYNLNVPALPFDQVKGLRAATLNPGSVVGGYEWYDNELSGKWYFPLLGKKDTPAPGSDRALLNEGYATATYLSWNMSAGLEEAPTF